MVARDRDSRAVHVIRVLRLDRRHPPVIEREFLDYDQALGFLDRMRELYAQDHLMEFDTTFDRNTPEIGENPTLFQ